MSLRDVKAKIRSVDRTRKVTKAMEAVSAVKMRKSNARAIQARPYARAALSILERLSPSLTTVRHPLTTARIVRRAALVVVTSDKGLCGALNGSVLKEAERVVASLALPPESIDVYAFGKKASEYFGRRGYTLKGKFENVSDDVSLNGLDAVASDVTSAFERGVIDQVLVVYTNFKSTFEQVALSHTMLPLELGNFREIVAGIVPDKGALAQTQTPSTPPAFYTVEPSADGVLATLLPRLSSVLLFHMLLEGKASEHSARMVAMKNASDKSRDVSKALTRVFNKTRQAAITREVSEIVGGIEAMVIQ
jgi:F-type H+-transporting ATPase subunit gamma